MLRSAGRECRRLPNDAALVRGAFYAQALVLDPPANAFGATVANALAGRIGAK